MSFLEIHDLNVHYGAIHALHGIGFTVEKGSIVTLIGANGAGKSTTLRAISGLNEPTSGRIVFDGHDITGWAPHKVTALGLIHVPEGRGIFQNLTVDENLEIGAFQRKDKAGIKQDRARALALFPRIGERLQQNAGTLSGGEQQMLAIARALMARPRMLLLDEPSLGLAPQIVQTIFKIIKDINAEGVTILLVEQNANMALRAAHFGHVLEVGKIVLSDTAAKLEASDSVRAAYLGGHA